MGLSLFSRVDDPGVRPWVIWYNMPLEGSTMNITIKMGGAVLALRLIPADIRAILIAAALVLHPASRPALGEMQRAVAQFVTWSSSSGGAEIRGDQAR